MKENPENIRHGSEKVKNVEGHPALRLERREGEIYTEDGLKLIPDFKIGPEQHHLDAFIEYERTFGRGKAYAITHNPGGVNPKYESAKKEYPEFAGTVSATIGIGTKEECETLLAAITRFRNQYPELFDDVAENNPARGKNVWKDIDEK